MSLLYIPLFPTPLYQFFYVLYISLVGTTIITWFLASKVDPSDPNIYGLGKVNNSSGLVNYCRICRSVVMEGSKHCAKCDKCVEGFDHHCEWLNTCVGKSNYRMFFILTTFMTLAYLMKTLIAAYLICIILRNNGNLDVPEWYAEKNQEKYLILIICFSVKDPIVLVVLMNLLAFHIYLKIRGITTYEYLMGKKNENKKQDLTQKKIQELQSKQDNNDKNLEKTESLVINQGGLENDEKIKKNDNILKKNEGIINENHGLNIDIDKDHVILEENEMNFTKESAKMGDQYDVLKMKELGEIKIKTPFNKQTSSHRSGEIAENDEESLNLSGIFYKFS